MTASALPNRSQAYDSTASTARGQSSSPNKSSISGREPEGADRRSGTARSGRNEGPVGDPVSGLHEELVE
ncbi:MAG: hypothetical protein J07HQW2_02229 [Haloquadratum walsbyi J07HQW2]|uniref:Uncharacterized protein n=1 Tax=Haloquadratum walsbyi J07HQW2 TaxID=1238425 RepID=U1MZ25_9EURY|nr:hypothetical protein [Haloquadratum walsbyi]ERG95769.1 MAG: hypothetical protein J07HQW2_02229 [Haloquadratum walsbyi J07HQW2]